MPRGKVKNSSDAIAQAILGDVLGRKEGNVLFNDALNTFYFTVIWLQTYGKGPFRFFYMHHPTNRITHTTAFITRVVEHWLEQEIAQWVHPMKDRSDDPSHHERTLLPRSYTSLPAMFSDSVVGLWLYNKMVVSVTVIIHFITDHSKEQKAARSNKLILVQREYQ